MNKKLVGVVVSIFVVVIVVVLLFVKQTPSTPVSSRYSVPNSLSSAVSYTSNSLVYSNGQSLVSYNFVSGAKDVLSSTNDGLNNIDTVSASGNSKYILFHDQLVDSSGTLGQQLTAAGLDPQMGYWWVYSIDSGLFSALPQKTVFAKFSGNSVYGLSPGNGNETLTTYDPADLSPVTSTSVPGSINFYPNQGKFILQTPSNEVLYTNSGSVNQVLFKSASVVGLNQDTVIAVETNGSNRQLVSYNLNNNKVKVIASYIQGQPAWLSSGYALFTAAKSASSTEGIYQYEASTNSVKLWKLDTNIGNFGSAGPTINTLLSPNAAIVSDSSSSYYIAGNQIANPSNASL